MRSYISTHSPLKTSTFGAFYQNHFFDLYLLLKVNIKKTLISTFCDFSLTFYLQNRCKCIYGTKLANKLRKNLFLVGILKATDEKSRIRIRNPVYGFKDPDPSQNVTDPEHCKGNPSHVKILLRTIMYYFHCF